MKTFYAFCLAVLVLGMSQSCSLCCINGADTFSNVPITCAGTPEAHARYHAHHDYDVSAFERVEVQGNFCVHLVQADHHSLHIDGMSQQDLQRLTVVCADGLLQVIDRRKKVSVTDGNECLCLTVTMPSIDGLESRGAMSLYCPKWKQQEPLSLQVSGAGLCHFGHVAFGDVSIDCSGAADIDLGTMQSSSVQMQVSGAVEAKGQVTTLGRMQSKFSGAAEGNFDIKARDISVQASGACNVEMNVACASLSAHNSGAGNMVFRGTADSTQIDHSGVTCIDTSHLNEF